jgi:hypothetical protein
VLFLGAVAPRRIQVREEDDVVNGAAKKPTDDPSALAARRFRLKTRLLAPAPPF